jgi:hypothetical protein
MKMLLLAIVAVAACNPTLTAQSPSPPGRSARLDPVTGFWGVKSYRLELSQGVAIAVTCDRGDPCEHMQVTSDDPAIAEVRAASLGVLQQGMYGSAETSAALVVIGKAPGTTIVRVRARQGSRLVAVRVVAPPPQAPAMADQPLRSDGDLRCGTGATALR